MVNKELPRPQNTHAQGGGPCWCGYALDFTKYRNQPKETRTEQAAGMYKKVR